MQMNVGLDNDFSKELSLKCLKLFNVIKKLYLNLLSREKQTHKKSTNQHERFKHLKHHAICA